MSGGNWQITLMCTPRHQKAHEGGGKRGKRNVSTLERLMSKLNKGRQQEMGENTWLIMGGQSEKLSTIPGSEKKTGNNSVHFPGAKEKKKRKKKGMTT